MIIVRNLMLCGFVLLVSTVGCSIDENGIGWAKRDGAKRVVVDPKKEKSHEYRCMVLHDPSQDAKLTPPQLRMLYGRETKKFMTDNGFDGLHSYKVLDGTPDGLSQLTGIWKQMADANPPASLPWVIQTNGPSKPIAKPLPTDWAEWQFDGEKMAGVN